MGSSCQSPDVEESSSESEPAQRSVRSPFSGTHSSVQKAGGARNSRKIGLAVAFALVLLGAGYFVLQSINDPLRTLREFPIEEYYTNHASFEGTRFRGQLKAVTQLGWKREAGRLVLFGLGETEKPAVVLIPPKFENLSIEPGESFQAELLVGEGGLITASLVRRN